MNIWEALFITPLTTALLFFYDILGENLGLAIIVLTVVLRIVLYPMSVPALRSMKIQRDIKPELDRLKNKYKGDRQKLAVAQMELFKQKGVNPFAGCLPQILQLIILIALYTVFMSNLKNGELNHQFLLWDLSARDPYFVFPVLAAVSQFVLSKMMLPVVSQEHEAAHQAKDKKEDFASAFQRQNLFLFPVLTLVLGFQFPAGLMLYWFISTLLQIPQQWLVMRSRPAKSSG
uniref:Membrane protein insertase YidC n=1 Tax=candidate division WWE3 bacterium TaxID=2053526 RepID=A0A832DRP5_UNCKA